MPLHSFTCLSVVGLDSNLSLNSNSLSEVCKRKEEGNSPIANPAQTREQPNPQTLLPAQTVSPGKLHTQAQSLPATSFPQPSGPASEVQQPSAPARPEAQHRGPFFASTPQPANHQGPAERARPVPAPRSSVARSPASARRLPPLAARPDPRVRIISFPGSGSPVPRSPLFLTARGPAPPCARPRPTGRPSRALLLLEAPP